MKAVVDCCEKGHGDLIHDEDEFQSFVSAINRRISYPKHLFTTNISSNFDLFEIFLDNLPGGEHVRQYYNCNACRSFITRYGGLVFLTDDYNIIPAIWPNSNDVPEMYRAAVSVCYEIVLKRAKITGVFYAKEEILGIPVTGDWTHLYVNTPQIVRSFKITQTPHQAMAEKKEDIKLLVNLFGKYPLNVVKQGVRLLKTGSLHRSETCRSSAEWLLKTMEEKINLKKNNLRLNMLWAKVAAASPGFCHIKNGVLGTLFDDIEKGKNLNTISRNFKEKVRADKHQRPQELPTDGATVQAWKKIELMGAEASLKRRFARIEEIKKMWIPRQVSVTPLRDAGAFSNLKTKDSRHEIPSLNVPAQNITWVKFKATVLKDAERIEFYVPTYPNSFAALVTASDPDAVPILQWDNFENRNPVSWYLYHGGSLPTHWGLRDRNYCEVKAITQLPYLWSGYEWDNRADGVILILSGAQDRQQGGLGLFPSILKKEFHEIRAVMEAYSTQNQLEGRDEASACGILIGENFSNSYRVKVFAFGGTSEYIIDRWD